MDPLGRGPGRVGPLFEVGTAFGLRPAGIQALDISRVEASLILIEAEYTSARHAFAPELKYSPFEIGLGRLVAFEKEARFTGRRALLAERAGGGPARRLVGLELDWSAIEAMYARHGLAPQISLRPPRSGPRVPGGLQVGRATSVTWGPTIKKMVGRLRWTGAHRSGNARVRRMDRGGRARQGRRDGGADALPRPRAQTYLTHERRPIHRIVCERLDR